MKGVALGTGALAIVLLLVGGWIGGEMHYHNCLQAAEARYPTAYATGSEAGQYGDWRAKEPRFVFYEAAKREEAISNCSRWP